MPPSPPVVPDSSIDPLLRGLPAPTRTSRPLPRRSSSQPKSYKPQKPHIGSSSSSNSESDDDDLEFQGKAQGDGEFRLSDLSEIDDDEEEDEGVRQEDVRREWQEQQQQEEEGGFAFGDWNRIGTGGEDIQVGEYHEEETNSNGQGEGGEEVEVQIRESARKGKKRSTVQRDPNQPRPIPTQRKRLLEMAARNSRALLGGNNGVGGVYGNGLPITSYASGSVPGWEGIGFADTSAGRGRSCENCRHRKSRCSSHEICENCSARGDRCIWKTGTPLYATPAFTLPSHMPAADISTSLDGPSQPQLPPRNYELYPSPTYASLVAETSRLRRLANILTNRWCMRESVLAGVEGRAMRRCVGIQDVKVEDDRMELPIPPPSLVKRVKEQAAEKEGDQAKEVEPQVGDTVEAAKEKEVEEGGTGGVGEEERGEGEATTGRENTELEDAAILLALSQPQSQSHSQTQTPQDRSPVPEASTSTSNAEQPSPNDPNSTTKDGNEMIDPVLRTVGPPPPSQNMKPPQKPKQRNQPTFPQHLAPSFPSSFHRSSASSTASPRVRSVSAQAPHQYRPVPPVPTRPGSSQPRARSFSANNQPLRSAPHDSQIVYPPGYRPVNSNHRGVPYHPQQQQHPYNAKSKASSRSSQQQQLPYPPPSSSTSASRFNYDYNPAYHQPSYNMPTLSRFDSRRPSTINPQALPKFPSTVVPAATTSKKRSSSSSIPSRSISSSTWIASIPPRGGPSPPLFFPAIPSPSMSAQQQAKNESDRTLEKLRRTHWEWREKRKTWHEERFERCLLRQEKRELGVKSKTGNKKRKTTNNSNAKGKGKQPTAQERSLAIQAAETWATLNAVNQRQAQEQAQAQTAAEIRQRDRERNKLPPIVVPVQPYRSISSSQVGPFREDAMLGGGGAMMLGPSSSMLSAMEGPEGSRRSAGSGGADGRRFSQWLMSPLSSTFNPIPSTSSHPLSSTSSIMNVHEPSSLASAFDHSIPISRPLTPTRPIQRIAIDSPDRSRHLGSPNTVDAGLKPLSELFGSATDSVDERFEPRVEKDDTFGGSGARATDEMDWDPFEPMIEARRGEGASEKAVEGGMQDLGWNSPGRPAREPQVAKELVVEAIVARSGTGENGKENVEVVNDGGKGKENVDTSEMDDAIAALDRIKNA